MPNTIRPIGVYALSGLATVDHRLWAIDQIRGYLVSIDPDTQNTTVLNGNHLADWMGAVGLAVWQETIWFAKGRKVFSCDRQTFELKVFAELPYDANGVAVWESTVYVTCQKSGYIHLFERSTGEFVTKFPQPGIGAETLAISADQLWVCDRTEQTVYCLDRGTGKLRFSALTPFSSPTAISFYATATDPTPICYIAYADEEPYIRDDPNARFPYQIAFRDRTLIHPLTIQHYPEAHYTISNGYLIELSYVEELLPLDALLLHDVEWRIALPANTLRQRVKHIESIGHDYTIEEQDGQKVAVFRFDKLQPNQGGVFGWKAILEVYSLKYYLSPADVETSPELPIAFQQRYLIDDDQLMMDSPTILRAAAEASGTETNVLRKMLKIRNYVYDRLSYGIQPHIDTPDVALDRGIASCGEYVGVLLALARLNGIACRTIGRYKCPQYPELKNLPLSPDFNHVWLEFFVPGIGWLPMESNVDDVIERGPYPERFFMGLAWYHTELGKGIKFEKITAADLPEETSLGDLAINHVRFTILAEL